jgi:hypothetical protein
MRFGADGLVSAEAGVLGPVLGSAKDRGRWWVDGEKLCTKWFRWFDAQVRCLTIARDGSRIAWRKIDDGETGTATLIQEEQPTQKAPQNQDRTVVAKADAPKAPKKKVEAAPAPSAPPVAAVEVVAPPASETAEQTVVAQAERALPPEAPGERPMMRFGGAGLLDSSAQAAGREELAPAVPPSSVAGPHKTAAAPALSDMASADLSPVRRPSAAAKKQAVAKRPAPVIARAPEAPPKTKEGIKQRHAGLATSSIRTVALYRVQGVRRDDVLNVRRGPSDQHVQIAAIPPTGRQVEITGRCQLDWCPIRYGGIQGWVNRYYLTEDGWRDETTTANVR